MRKFIALIIAMIMLITLTSCGQTDAVSHEKYQAEMFEAVNKERAAAGLKELTLNSDVCESASVRASEISSQGNFSHTRPDGSGCFTALNVDFSLAGENIAQGQYDIGALMKGWMDSPQHRQNILNSDFTQAGFGLYESNGMVYWVQIFVALN